MLRARLKTETAQPRAFLVNQADRETGTEANKTLIVWT